MAMKTRFCWRCRRWTPHTERSVDPILGGGILARIVTGLMTLGVSETLRYKEAACRNCGNRGLIDD